jgi:Helix-turn-helix domain of resolvase
MRPYAAAMTLARRQAIGRPKTLDSPKAALAQRMHASGESAALLRRHSVSRAAIYRVLADRANAD